MTILLSLTRMMKKMFAAFAFNQSLTHSLTDLEYRFGM